MGLGDARGYREASWVADEDTGALELDGARMAHDEVLRCSG
jgi:hypothetical protein